MKRLTKTSPGKIRWLLTLTLMLTSMSWSGCESTKVKVIAADQAEVFVPAGKPVTPTVDSVLMPEARYQRYRRAVADKIAEVQLHATNR